MKSQNNENLSQQAQKLSETKFNYLSIDSWCLLFYQLIKIYYLAKVSLKTLKSFPGLTTDQQAIPDYYLDGSNFLSNNEIILFRWLEIHYELNYPLQKKRITNFSEDLKDGLVLA